MPVGIYWTSKAGMTKIDVGASGWNSHEDVARTFTRLIDAASGACNWLKANKPRNDATLAEFNFLPCSVTYLEIVRGNLPAKSKCWHFVRSEYELYLLAKRAFSSDVELRRWLGETAADNLVVMEAVSTLVTSENTQSTQHQIDAFKTTLRETRL